MNRSESDPPSGEEEEEIQSSSSESESDWLMSLSKQDHVEYSEALDACTISWHSFRMVSLSKRAKVLLEKDYTYKVGVELIVIRQSILEGHKDLKEKLDHLTLLVPIDWQNKICGWFSHRLKRAKRCLVKINKFLGEDSEEEEEEEFSDSDSESEEEEINDKPHPTPTKPENQPSRPQISPPDLKSALQASNQLSNQLSSPKICSPALKSAFQASNQPSRPPICP